MVGYLLASIHSSMLRKNVSVALSTRRKPSCHHQKDCAWYWNKSG